MTDQGVRERAREEARKFFSANRSVIKRFVEAESDLGFHQAKLQEELENDFTAALLQARREALEEAAIRAYDELVILPDCQRRVARAIRQLKEK